MQGNLLRVGINFRVLESHRIYNSHIDWKQDEDYHYYKYNIIYNPVCYVFILLHDFHAFPYTLPTAVFFSRMMKN